MVKLSRIKENRINRKGQSLVEIAVFGSLLLMVLGFLLSSGLKYNHQQDIKMEAFRQSLLMAAESNLSRTQDLVVVKDLLIPDPSDMFALGERSSFRGSSNLLWSNKTSDLDYSSLEKTPSVTYNFDPDNENINQTYTTSSLINRGGAITGVGPLILRGVYNPYPGSPGKIYNGEDGNGPNEVMILMNHAGDCEDVYCPKTILDEATVLNRGAWDYYPVFGATGNAGATPTAIFFTDSEGGQINSTLMKMQVDNKVLDKDRSLTLTENSAQYQSTEAINDEESIHHVIMTTSGDSGPTIVYTNEPVPTWTTPK